MQINPYLHFNGNCEEAFRFYERCLGAKIVAMIPHEGTPAAEHVPAEWRSKIMHASLEAGDTRLMGSDVPPDHYQPVRGVSVAVALSDTGEGEKIFNALAENGTVQMPFQKTFWSPGFGMLVDQFGIPWMINCDQPA